MRRRRYLASELDRLQCTDLRVVVEVAAPWLGEVPLHQTRHTYARLVAESTGSITETQDALGHKNVATTRVYVQRIDIKRDKHSRNILGLLELSADK